MFFYTILCLSPHFFYQLWCINRWYYKVIEKTDNTTYFNHPQNNNKIFHNKRWMNECIACDTTDILLDFKTNNNGNSRKKNIHNKIGFENNKTIDHNIIVPHIFGILYYLFLVCDDGIHNLCHIYISSNENYFSNYTNGYSFSLPSILTSNKTKFSIEKKKWISSHNFLNVYIKWRKKVRITFQIYLMRSEKLFWRCFSCRLKMQCAKRKLRSGEKET